MATKGTRNLTLPTKIFMVFACACMTAFMWRLRGSHGWGSMWGMFSVGATLILFIFAFFGNRRKMSYEAIPFGIALFGITCPGWGTLNSQMGGYLDSSAAFSATDEVSTVAISPYSGLAIMLLLGFGMIPLFSIFIGSLFSKKEYSIWKYVIIIAVFYAVAIGFQFSISHYILPKINPQAVEGFKLGLSDKGIELSPMMAYIKNLGNISVLKKIPFGRNYTTSIVVISRAIAGLACSLVALTAFRDKLTGLVSFGINIVSAISITLASLPMIADSDRGFLATKQLPKFLTGDSWQMWEIFTGFFLGFGIMLILVCLPRKALDGEGKYKEKSFFSKPILRYLYSSLLVLFFPFGLLIARPLGMRISEILFEMNKIKSEGAVETAVMIAAIIVALIICLVVGKKSYLDKGLQVPVPSRCEDFCGKALPFFFIANAIIYFFSGSECIITLPFAEMKSFAAIKMLIFNGTLSAMLLTIAAFILFLAFFLISKKLSKAQKK